MFPRHLITRFAKARLPLELLDRPLFRGAGAGDIVQIDVARPDRRARTERFRIFPGAESNRVEALTVDPNLRQLVLLVHEPRRRFENFVSKYQQREPPTGVVKKTEHGWWIERFTAERKRHFLAGMDEHHLFIAQLPRATSTVWGAHVALKGDDVRNAERGAFEKTLRQGEWFFISLLPRELLEVEQAASGSLARIRKGVGIAEAAGFRRGGRPHVADEVLVLDGKAYVRGKVRHPDHATLELREWRRALGNTESFEQPQGVGFVD